MKTARYSDAQIMGILKQAEGHQYRTCLSCLPSYRYSPVLSDENEEIADWLERLTENNRTWGFGLCFLYLRNVQGYGWNHKRVYPTGRQVIVCNHRQADLL